MKIKLKEYYTHRKNKKTYYTLFFATYKASGLDIDCIVYCDEKGNKFIRCIDNFKKSFSKDERAKNDL